MHAYALLLKSDIDSSIATLQRNDKKQTLHIALCTKKQGYPKPAGNPCDHTRTKPVLHGQVRFSSTTYQRNSINVGRGWVLSDKSDVEFLRIKQPSSVIAEEGGVMNGNFNKKE